MTIIKSAAIGSARKSLGELTYKRLRGRTIASQRITENKSNTTLQQKQRNAFAILSKTTKILKPVVDLGFPKTKHGSPNNNFMATNKEYSNFIKNTPSMQQEDPSILTMYAALTDERFIGNILSAKGSYATSTWFEWDEERQIMGYIDFSRNYEAGDKITIVAAYSYKRKGGSYEMVRMCEKELGSSDINALTVANEFIVNTTVMPELKELFKLPKDATDLYVVMTGIITGKAGPSTSLFMPTPQRPYELEVVDQLVLDSSTLQLNFKDMEEFSYIYDSNINGAVLYIEGGDYPTVAFTAYDFAVDEDGQNCGIKFKAPDDEEMVAAVVGGKEKNPGESAQKPKRKDEEEPEEEKKPSQLILEGILIALVYEVQYPEFVV